MWVGVACVGFAQTMVSPNGKISLTHNGKCYQVSYQQQSVLEIPVLGYGNSVQKVGKARLVKADYEMLTGKKLHCTNEANEYLLTFDDGIRLVMRLYNDGLAFRYEGVKEPRNEQTAYRMPVGAKRWMQKWSDGYEGFFPLETSVQKGRWGYPALLETANGVFALISEANIEKGQSASCLYSDDDTYKVVPDETIAGKEIDRTPWRIIIIGTLPDIVASTLVTDVSDPSKIDDISWIHPGTVSWIYWAHNHGSNDYQIIKQYVDMAVTLKLPYVLIDAEWDEMKDGKSILDAVNYSKWKGIKPMIWYNSSVGWVNGAPGPKFRLNDLQNREREFQWCQDIGVVGVKIDFFSGDNQSNMDYMLDLLESASRYHLLINFHGATIPRGWQRTYPHLLTTEAVYGAEWYNNNGVLTNKAACHNATLPFTRNVIGPMDYTPCAFSDSQHPHITTHGHELALTVLFESGLQHLADRPESLLAQPKEVQEFFGQLPAAWDDTKLICGYPGEYVALARRSGDRWYVAILNGTDSPKEIVLDWSRITPKPVKGRMFGDSSNSRSPWTIKDIDALPEKVTLMARGGCVIVINN